MLFGELVLNAAKKSNAFSLKCQHLYLYVTLPHDILPVYHFLFHSA